MSDLPIGWGDRHNTMSEKDMALGGSAATRFISKQSRGVYQEGDVAYKSSDDVREYYRKQMEVSSHQGNDNNSPLPVGWSEREKEKDTLAKQQGVFAASKDSNLSLSSTTAEVALLQVTTNSLESLASVMESESGISIPSEDRARFAVAVKKAMDALAARR